MDVESQLLNFYDILSSVRKHSDTIEPQRLNLFIMQGLKFASPITPTDNDPVKFLLTKHEPERIKRIETEMGDSVLFVKKDSDAAVKKRTSQKLEKPKEAKGSGKRRRVSISKSKSEKDCGGDGVDQKKQKDPFAELPKENQCVTVCVKATNADLLGDEESDNDAEPAEVDDAPTQGTRTKRWLDVVNGASIRMLMLIKKQKSKTKK